MASGFVSGGTIDTPIERDDAWLSAQKEIEANRQRKLDEQAAPTDGRSLYEILEANKAAKQDAFEEANRLKNQFRALDEDEIDFLDSVLESTRAEEERIKRETQEGLELFRRQQDEVDKKKRTESTGADDGSPTVEEESWTTSGRKRKRAKDKEGLKGVKLRRTSTTDEKAKHTDNAATNKSTEPVPLSKIPPKPTSPAVAKEVSLATKSSLVAYGSDSEDD